MARKRKQRRQQHGSAWHWKPTDSWYYAEPDAKTRVPLFDEKGERIRGNENKEAARAALARIKRADEFGTPSLRRGLAFVTVATRSSDDTAAVLRSEGLPVMAVVFLWQPATAA